MINGLEEPSCYYLVVHSLVHQCSHHSGDFWQYLPVIPHASRSLIVAATISNAIFWKDVIMMHLTINMQLLQQLNHTSEEVIKYILAAQQFAAWLLIVGEGKRNQEHKIMLPPGIISSLNSFVPNFQTGLCLPSSHSPLSQIIYKVYDGIQTIQNLHAASIFQQKGHFICSKCRCRRIK